MPCAEARQQRHADTRLAAWSPLAPSASGCSTAQSAVDRRGDSPASSTSDRLTSRRMARTLGLRPGFPHHRWIVEAVRPRCRSPMGWWERSSPKGSSGARRSAGGSRESELTLAARGPLLDRVKLGSGCAGTLCGSRPDRAVRKGSRARVRHTERVGEPRHANICSMTAQGFRVPPVPACAVDRQPAADRGRGRRAAQGEPRGCAGDPDRARAGGGCSL